MNDATKKRRHVRLMLAFILALVAIAPACIFDQGHYEGGGTSSQGASTNQTAANPDSGAPPSDTSTSTSTATATSTSTAPVDAGASG